VVIENRSYATVNVSYDLFFIGFYRIWHRGHTRISFSKNINTNKLMVNTTIDNINSKNRFLVSNPLNK